MPKRKIGFLILFSVIVTVIFLLAELPVNHASATTYTFHSDAERIRFEELADSLPGGFNVLFAASGECDHCHGYDPEGLASVNLLGEDINLVDDWRASMMANSTKDPFWRAKVSHEVLLYPQLQQQIEHKCTSCHAPMGHFAAIHEGQEYYSMAEAITDTIALDGVSCLACHKQTEEDLGHLHSGHMNFDTAKVAYGPYISPLESPMVGATDYLPVYSEHISDAGICAGCHSLVTETVDYAGNYTGNTFVEQATYHEWLNSEYEVDDVTCQTCHMEAMSKGEVIIIAGYETEPRTPFYLHELAGANIFMLKIFRDNIEELGLNATYDQFTEAIAATEDMLVNRTLSLDLEVLQRSTDTVYLALKISNMAGHKFPSGYPSRRAFVEFTVQDEFGDTIFISGKTDENQEVIGHDPDFEPHFDVIRSEDEVQIYELVVADVNDNVTTVLVRGDHALKDNRLPPQGFTTSHATYDTVRIVGEAVSDPNFNMEEGQEGSGSDIVYFNIPTQGNLGALEATAKVFYQTAPPKWMEEMFAESTEEIDYFRTLFDEAEKKPILIRERSVDIGSIVSNQNIEDQVSFARLINHTPRNILYVTSMEKHSYSIFDNNGKTVLRESNQNGDYEIRFHLSSGLYGIRFTDDQGRSITEKFIVP